MTNEEILRAVDKFELALLNLEHLPLEAAIDVDAEAFAKENGLSVSTVVLAQLLLDFVRLGKVNHQELPQVTARLLITVLTE